MYLRKLFRNKLTIFDFLKLPTKKVENFARHLTSSFLILMKKFQFSAGRYCFQKATRNTHNTCRSCRYRWSLEASSPRDCPPPPLPADSYGPRRPRGTATRESGRWARWLPWNTHNTNLSCRARGSPAASSP